MNGMALRVKRDLENMFVRQNNKSRKEKISLRLLLTI
jgi:hypothetical protein